MIISWIILVIVETCKVTTFPNGEIQKACKDMMPVHKGYIPQTSPSPYTISASRLENGNLQVALSGSSFKGLLLKARNYPFRNESLGIFLDVPKGLKPITCKLPKEYIAISHSDNKVKNNVQLKWKPPAGYNNEIIFIATVLSNFSVFWTNVLSSPFFIKSKNETSYLGSSNMLISSNSSNSRMPRDELSFFDGCGTKKNCFGYPSGCINKRTCLMLASIKKKSFKYTFEILSKIGAYTSLGLSKDNKMGADSVVDCVKEENNVKVFMSWNIEGEKMNTRENITQDIHVIKAASVDGIYYCEILRDEVSVVKGQIFDLGVDKYHLLLCAGSSVTKNRVEYHDIAYLVSHNKQTLSANSVFEIESNPKLLVKLHGSFMVTAWIGTTSIGVIFARYFKQTWVEKSLCGKAIWFSLHRICMLVTFILTVTGFGLIFFDVGGWVGERSQLHGIMGCVTTALCCIQPIGAFFRPKPSSEYRPIFNWIHFFVGNAAHIYAIITIFLAVSLPKAELTKSLYWILIAFLTIYISVHLMLTISAFIAVRPEWINVNLFPISMLSRKSSSTIEKGDAPHLGFRIHVLVVYIFSVIAFTVSLVMVIFFASVEF